MQILLVEDDLALAIALGKALNKQGYTVNSLREGKLVVQLLHAERPDLVILDLGLPDIDGIDVLKQIRAEGLTLPVLILTARTELDDRVLGLDLGADDYLAKPFEMVELLARLRVLERRLCAKAQSTLTLGKLSLDINDLHVSFDGDSVELSKKERMVLKALMESGGKVVPRRKLEDKLYSWGEEVASNAIEVHIHHLRKKLGNGVIATVRGLGYRVIGE